MPDAQAATPISPVWQRRYGPGSVTGRGNSRLLGTLALLAIAALSTNPALTLASILAVYLFVRLLWRRGEPPVLFFVVMFQWLQVATRVFDADFRLVALSELPVQTADALETAIWLSLWALVVLALGIRLGTGQECGIATAAIRYEMGQLSSIRVFQAYLVLAVVGQVLGMVTWIYLPLSQILLALASLKLIPLFLLASLVFTQRRGHRLLAIAIVIEVIIGLGGYFSDFKTAFIVLILAASATRTRLKRRQMAETAVVGAALLVLFLFWTAVKSDYRAFLNRGTNTQAALVSWRDRLQYIRQAGARVGTSEIIGAIEPAVNRLGYVDFFAATILYVPGTVPHTDGEIWSAALGHSLMPRLLFPDKPVLINDSRITRRFTGLQIAAEDEGTSIGIGYVAESYVDYGRAGMWLPVFALGLLWGWMYRKLLRWAKHRAVAFGFAMICLLPAMFFETAASKQLGSALSRFIVLSVVLVCCERRSWRWLATHPAAPGALHRREMTPQRAVANGRVAPRG